MNNTKAFIVYIDNNPKNIEEFSCAYGLQAIQ